MSFAYPITQAVIDAILYRFTLADPDGFNGVFNALAPNYGVPANMAIQFPAQIEGVSPNFAMANIDPTVWIEAAAVSFPFMTLFGISSANRNLTKFHQFSGPVQIGVNVLLSWPQSRVLVKFQPLASCVEETMYTVFNRARNDDVDDQDWDFPSENVDVVYNGDLKMTASPVNLGGQQWFQLLHFDASFQVDAKGAVN